MSQSCHKFHFSIPTPLEKLIDHIDYIVKLVGADHLSLGYDYGGNSSSYTKGIKDAGIWPLITYRLLKSGYKENEIRKILGENFLKVPQEFEKASD